MSIKDIISRIAPLDRDAMQAALMRQETLTKPKGSLGRLEELSVQVAGITGNPSPRIEHKVVLVMAGDHGVVEEGVSAYPQAVTAQMVDNFLRGGAAISVLARHVGARVVVVDMGIAVDIFPHPDLLVKKIAHGTGNIACQAAMTREQATQALETGAEIVGEQIVKGMDILATGDMGIGNTTPSAAIAVALSERPVTEIAGRGTGVDQAGLQRKIEAIQRSLEINRPDPHDGLDVLAKVGGFEIGGLAGAILASAAHRRPVVIDGFISTAAAMVAVSLAPQARDYLIAAHTSQELGHHLMMEWLEIRPLLDLQMRLGEGTGAVLAMSLVEASCKILTEMATFDEARVSQKEAS
jgi:nicotinate-nucleotide--dimethylbenzimidazole phosphoribosyltransferase